MAAKSLSDSSCSWRYLGNPGKTRVTHGHASPFTRRTLRRSLPPRSIQNSADPPKPPAEERR